MTTRNQNPAIERAVACAILALMIQAAPAATFNYLLPDDSFQQLWSNTTYWTSAGGTDDGGNGYPDGTDTIIMDRSPTASTSTRLAIEGGPPFAVAGITGTGGNQRDVVFKFGIFTLGDLEVLPSSYPSFWIQCERDKDLTINGVISGTGELWIERSGGFSDGVDPDELITFTGPDPNTITGTIRLFNSSDSLQPCYWVADKVAAFGQTPQLTLEGTKRSGPNDSGIASLAITANAIGGEGAIDDDATEVYIGYLGVLDVAAGVDEVIGEGKLFIDLAGTGSYTAVTPGTYDNSVAWITGAGTVTVGNPDPGPENIAITSITKISGDIWELKLVGEASTAYEFRSSPSLTFDPGTLLSLSPGVPAVGTVSSSVVITTSEGDGTVRVTLTGSSSNFVRAQAPTPPP